MASPVTLIVRRPADVRIAVGLVGLAGALALRIAVAGVDGVHSVPAGLAFGVAVAAVAVLTATRLVAPPRTFGSLARLIGYGVVGAAVLCLPAAIRHADGLGVVLPVAGYLPWAVGVSVVAVAEETLLRGSLFTAVQQRAGTATAIAVTSLAFAALHVPLYGTSVFVLDLAVGVWLGALRAVSGSVAVPAIAHTLADLAGVVAAVKRARIIVVALAILGIGWALAPRSAPPLYDGVGFPDEPYRFVVKPDGAPDTKIATIATGTTQVIGGQAGAVHANSAELAPQIAFLIPVDRLHAPAGTTQIVMKGTPVQPIAAPSGTYLWSNVYDIEATIGSVTLASGDPPATLTLRAATAQRPYPSIERYTGSGWVKVKTVAVGNDIYQSTLPAVGRYAVIGSTPIDVAQLNGASKAKTTNTGIIIAAGAVVVIIALIVVGVWRRRELSRRSAD